MPGELEKIRVWFRDYKVPTCLRPSHTASRAMSLLVCMLRRALPIYANLVTTALSHPLQTPDGKPQNSYGYNDECLNKEFTIGVIEETHGFWNKLRSGERKNSEELALQ